MFDGMCVPAGVYKADSLAMSLSWAFPSAMVNRTFDADSGITMASGCWCRMLFAPGA